jgi:predicted GNAT family N-acyltransferase
MAVSLLDLELVCFDPNVHDVRGFDCGDSDLNDFLKNDSAGYQAEHLSQTRLAFFNRSLVGYITLLADCIVLKTSEKKRLLEFHQSIYTFPALKIGRLGIQNEFKKSGMGTQLLKYSVGLVVRLNNDLSVGCRFITVDAYPDSISWYEKKGFLYNKHYTTPERTHPSIRYDILKSPQIG